MKSQSVGISTVTLVKRRVQLSHSVSDAVLQNVHLESEVMPYMRATMLTQWRDYFANPLAEVAVSIPETWWDALKQALRARWPRLFRRLAPRMWIVKLSADDIYPGVLPPAPGLGESIRMLDWSQRRDP